MDDKIIALDIGYIPLETEGDQVTKAELVEVSIPYSEVHKIDKMVKGVAKNHEIARATMETEQYKRNPIVIGSFDINKPIGKATKVENKDGVLSFDIELSQEYLDHIKNLEKIS